MKRSGGIVARFSVLIGLILMSCDDDRMDDTTPPQVTVNGVVPNQIVWNVVMVTIDATDNDQVKRVDVYIDESLIDSFTSLPHAVSWNTHDFDDGNCTLKVVVTDNAGNSEMVYVPLTISNVLMTVEISKAYVNPPFNFIFLSADNGKLIAAKEINDLKTIMLEAPDFDGDKFYVTEVELSEVDPGDVWIHSSTYVEITRGTTWRIPPPKQPPQFDYPDTALVPFVNALPGYSYELNTNGIWNKVDANNLSAEIPLKKSPSRLYIVAFDSDGDQVAFKLVPSISDGINNVVDLSEVDNPFSKIIVNFPPDALIGGAAVTGFDRPDNYDEGYWIKGSSMKDGSAEVLFPENAFPAYSFYVGYSGDNYMFYSKGRTEFTPEPMPYNFEINRFKDRIEYTATGDFDFLQIHIGADHQSWTYNLMKGTDVSVPTFEIPSIISDQIRIDFSHAFVSQDIFDYEDIGEYEELIFLLRQKGELLDFEGDGKNFKTLRLLGEENDAEGRYQNAPSRMQSAKRR